MWITYRARTSRVYHTVLYYAGNRLACHLTHLCRHAGCANVTGQHCYPVLLFQLYEQTLRFVGGFVRYVLGGLAFFLQFAILFPQIKGACSSDG